MTQQEIEKAIENGESVWCCLCENLLEFRSDNMAIFEGQVVGKTEIQKVGLEFLTNNSESFYIPFRELYKTKAEAEHYLHHANITRTETLPFLTWEEFLEEGAFDFYSRNHEWFTMYWNDVDGIVIESIDGFYKKTWVLTEANFYKAYDECVRLFKGEEWNFILKSTIKTDTKFLAQ